jgi:hypothetical protein
MFTFSKKNLTMGLMLLSALCCVESSKEKEVVPVDHRSKQVKYAGGFWSRLGQLIGFGERRANGKKTNWGRLGLSALVATMFIVGMLALSLNLTGIDADFGKNIFGDEGASMWLRLAVGLSFMTLSIGALSVAIHRARFSENMTAEQYTDWKNGHNVKEAAWRKKNSSQKLQLIFYGALMVLAVFTMIAGHANYDNTMFYFAFGLPLLVGISGFVYVCMHYGSDELTQHNEGGAQKKSIIALKGSEINVEDLNLVGEDGNVTGQESQGIRRRLSIGLSAELNIN